MTKSSNLREEELKKEGWVKRTALEEPRLSEVIELYESLGFEILLEPTRPGDMGAECSKCYEKNCTKYSVVYTRKIGEGK